MDLQVINTLQETVMQSVSTAQTKTPYRTVPLKQTSNKSQVNDKEFKNYKNKNPKH
jgi:hypothetical protein